MCMPDKISLEMNLGKEFLRYTAITGWKEQASISAYVG